MKIKYILIGILLFFIFYFEPIRIGPIKFALIWKIPLLLYLLIKIKYDVFSTKISTFSFLFYSKYLLTTGVLIYGYYFDGLWLALRGMSIPLLFTFFLLPEQSPKNLIKLLYFVVSFIILSTIPFHLHLIEPISRGYQLGGYGVDAVGFVGLFQNPHGGSIIIAQALIILVFLIFNKKRINIYLIILLLIGVYTLYNTYVRTGYLVFIIGSIILIYYRFGLSMIYKLSPLIVLVYFIFTNLVLQDDVLIRRILQSNIYLNEESIDVDRISSGRLTLSLTNLENYAESHPFTHLLGMGFKYSTDLMYEKIKTRKMSHNGYIDALVHNGIIGFALYIGLLVSIFKLIYVFRKSVYFPLAFSSFFTFLLFIFVQGGNIFLYEVQLFLILGLLIKLYLKKSPKTLN